MKRTTIVADDHVVQKLKALARDRGVSFAEVAREALEDKAMQYRPKPQSMGVASSSPAKTAATTASKRQPPRSWR